MKVFEQLKHSSDNSKIVLRNVLWAFVIKGLSMVVSFATTPLFIHYFNNNRVLGLWYTLLSVLIWFLNFDLGLGNGIRNNLVKAITKNDVEMAKKVISSGFFSVGITTIILSVIGSIMISLINLNQLFNIDSEIISSHSLLISTIFVFIAVMLRFFLTTVSSIFYALQKSTVNNFLALCVSILQMLFIIVCKFDSPETALINVSFAYIILSNLPIVIAGIMIFFGKLRGCRPSFRYVDKENIKAIMGIGVLFFLCQILYMVIANTNEFFITSLYGAEYTTEYTFYYKLATIGTVVISLALTPVWSVVTKAQAEGDFQWLVKLFRYIKIGGIGILVLQLILVPFVPKLMDIWLGEGTVDVSYSTTIAFAIFGAVFMYSGMLCTLANGLSMMKIQTISYSIAVILKVMLLFLCYRFTNWDFIVWVNTLILIPYIVAQHVTLTNFFTRQVGSSLS